LSSRHTIDPHKRPPRPLSQAPLNAPEQKRLNVAAQTPSTASANPASPRDTASTTSPRLRRTIGTRQSRVIHPAARTTPSGAGALERLLAGDPPLLVCETASPDEPRFRFAQDIDASRHHALVVEACADCFASPAGNEAGFAFIDALIDRIGVVPLSLQLLEQYGARLLEHAPPPWPAPRFPAIADAIERLSGRLSPQTQAALRTLVLALHPSADVAERLRALEAQVVQQELSGLPLSRDEALRLVRRLRQQADAALAAQADALVRSAVDLAQRVANACAPAGQPNDAAVQALVNVLMKAVPARIGARAVQRIFDWLFVERSVPAAKALGISLQPKAIGKDLQTARQQLQQWIHEQQTRSPHALPWSCLVELITQAGPLLHWMPSTWDWLRIYQEEALCKGNPQPLRNLLATLFADGGPAPADLIRELLERHSAPGVAAEHRAELLHTILPLLPHPYDDPRLHLAVRRLMDSLPEGQEKTELLLQHEALVKPLRTLGSSPSSHVAWYMQARDSVLAPQGAPSPSVSEEPVPLFIDPDAWFAPPSAAEVDQAYARLFLAQPAPIRLNAADTRQPLEVLEVDELKGLASDITRLCHDWIRTGRHTDALALLDAVLCAVPDAAWRRSLLEANSRELAACPEGDWLAAKGILSVACELAAAGWFLIDSPGHVNAATRVALLKALTAVDPLPAIGFLASEVRYALETDATEPLAPADIKHLAELLDLLLRLGKQQGDADLLKQSLKWARTLARRCGTAPKGHLALLQARANVIGSDCHRALTAQLIAKLSPWLTLRWQDGKGKHADSLQSLQVKPPCAALNTSNQPNTGLADLLALIEAQLHSPHGAPWPQLLTLLSAALPILRQDLDASVYWRLSSLEAQRTGNVQPLLHQLEHHQTIDGPDSALFQDVLAACSAANVSDADRAALLQAVCEPLLAAAPSRDPSQQQRRWSGVRSRLLAWIHGQIRDVRGLSLASIQALAQATPWLLEGDDWLRLCQLALRHRGDPSLLIDCLEHPADIAGFLDDALFRQVLRLSQEVPLKKGPRQRLLDAAQVLVRQRSTDMALRSDFAQAVSQSRTPRESPMGLQQALDLLFNGATALITPPADRLPAAFEVRRSALTTDEVQALIAVCDRWAGDFKLQAVRALLDAVLRLPDQALRRQLLTRYADALAKLLPDASQAGQWQGIVTAIAELAANGWATSGHPLETDPSARLVLMSLVRSIDWGHYASIELRAIEHQFRHLPLDRLLDGAGDAPLAIVVQLAKGSVAKGDSALARRAMDTARSLDARLAERPGHPHSRTLREKVAALLRDLPKARSDRARAALSTWFTLSSPGTGQAPLRFGVKPDDKALGQSTDRSAAWRALLDWVHVELDNPQGTPWPELQQAIETVERTWQQGLAPRQWLALALKETERSGSLSSLDRLLAMQGGTPLDEAMLHKLLERAGDTSYPLNGRAALLRHIVGFLPAHEHGNTLHEHLVRTLFTVRDTVARTALLKAYRRRHPQAENDGFIALMELMDRLGDETQRSSPDAWTRLSAAPRPGASADWTRWRRLCRELAGLMADRIRDIQTSEIRSNNMQSFQPKFNDLIVLVLQRLSSARNADDTTTVDRQFDLLRDLTQALAPAHRENFLEQVDASLSRHIEQATTPGTDQKPRPLPVKLLAMQGATRALAARLKGHAMPPATADRQPVVERSVHFFARLFHAILERPAGDRKGARALKDPLKALRGIYDHEATVSPFPTRVADTLEGLFAQHKSR